MRLCVYFSIYFYTGKITIYIHVYKNVNVTYFAYNPKILHGKVILLQTTLMAVL